MSTVPRTVLAQAVRGDLVGRNVAAPDTSDLHTDLDLDLDLDADPPFDPEYDPPPPPDHAESDHSRDPRAQPA